MKKLLLIILPGIIIALLGACTLINTDSGGEAAMADGNTVIIKEKMFIQQCSDIMINPEMYMDKTIQLEGMYKEKKLGDDSYQYVYRRGPGCCPGIDTEVGFICNYDGKKPDNSDWVRATGTVGLEDYGDGMQRVVLDLSKLEVLQERGEETVFN